ncbi:hypothetical protein PoB_006207200 [Plakobranchus ocellatus]|uniref:Uncharacterized protein n=1 Tax=Plakobranchus ocellatus TaxID=259542 RepID=A0AAV4CUI9_9GAST|nr:hypothetical protein PoB_006207200 [Plakobranchus ocellatus]
MRKQATRTQKLQQYEKTGNKETKSPIPKVNRQGDKLFTRTHRIRVKGADQRPTWKRASGACFKLFVGIYVHFLGYFLPLTCWLCKV